MRKIAANLIFPVSEPPVSHAYLVVDTDGTIVDIVNYNRRDTEIAGLEYYSGILVPGFVNAHCHLELSHLKNKIEPNTGLGNFVNSVQQKRTAEIEHIEQKMDSMLKFMWSRGINGLGDVVNTASGMDLKAASPIDIHNFVELFNEDSRTDSELTDAGLQLLDQFKGLYLAGSLAPHSLYGTRQPLLELIARNLKQTEPTSVHFLESFAESKQSPDTLIDFVKNLKLADHILLVHNTFATLGLIDALITDKALQEKLFWVLCPGSNLYIQNKLPEISLFSGNNMNVCLGTDSLASNTSLSILDEMKTVTKHFPEIAFDELLRWSTLNGAKALNMESKLGSFSPGKKPGVLLLTGFDFKNNKLTQQAEVTRLV